MTATSGSSRGGAAGNEPLVLGVDGGGTKTEAWLARFDAAGEPIVIGRGRGPSTNPRAVGLATALANLTSTIERAWRDAGRPLEPVDLAVFAISGAGRPEVREQITEYVLSTGLAARVAIEHDAEPLLAAGTPDGWGVGLIVGTGSAAIASDRSGQRYVSGGWGYWFGDEGSGYWIGRHALVAAARDADGRGPATALTQAIAQRLRVDEPRGMLGALEASGDVRRAIAAVAELVLEAAGQGDAAASDIVDRAAADLAELVDCAASKLTLGQEFPLVLAGGVACGSELLRSRLLTALAGRSLRPYPVSTVPNPVVGCLRLAWRKLNSPTA